MPISDKFNFQFPSSGRATSRLGALFILAVILFSAQLTAQAQANSQTLPTQPESIDAQRPKPSDGKPTLGSIDEEMRAKQNLKMLDHEYKETIQRAREAADLSAQLRDAIKSGRTFGRDETKKLERLEKLAKKIRDESGGSDSDEESLINNPPGKLDSALSRLADVAESLYKTLQETPRQVISATIIENANVLLKLARLTRGLFK
jgi:ribosome-binding protein aMBF1 (putative translation factor)